jgi:hypothetical protein
MWRNMSTISQEQLAHDLAIAYVNNRYGAEVKGELSVDTSDGDVTGWGTVETKRLPDTAEIRRIRVPTGEKHFFGLLGKTESIESGYEVDEVFKQMIEDYRKAYSRFLELLRAE